MVEASHCCEIYKDVGHRVVLEIPGYPDNTGYSKRERGSPDALIALCLPSASGK
jgi:hypothetical protein